jgi:hypothetical protein
VDNGVKPDGALHSTLIELVVDGMFSVWVDENGDWTCHNSLADTLIGSNNRM